MGFTIYHPELAAEGKQLRLVKPTDYTAAKARTLGASMDELLCLLAFNVMALAYAG